MKINANKAAASTRFYRKLHRWVAIPLLGAMFLLGATGLLLAWKKELKLTPEVIARTAFEQQTTLSLDSLQLRAVTYMKDSLQLAWQIDRMDVRPAKGIVKVRFEEHFTELQLDIYSGEVVSVRQRTSDIIEKLHDGSILDFLIRTNNDEIKLVYASLTSLGLMLLSISGFYLWFYPRQIKRTKRQKH